MTYKFTSIWNIDTPLDTVKQTIYDIDSWQSWWSGLESLEVLNFESDHIGSIAKMTWRSESGYRLVTDIVITAISDEGDLHFSSTGDLKGSGSWHFESIGDYRTRMTIHWNVVPTKWWMSSFSFMLRPLFESNHDKLMQDGEAGLRHFLARATQ